MSFSESKMIVHVLWLAQEHSQLLKRSITGYLCNKSPFLLRRQAGILVARPPNPSQKDKFVFSNPLDFALPSDFFDPGDAPFPCNTTWLYRIF